jgi:hypothetical protein
METKIFHGYIQPIDIARDIAAHFHRGNFQVQQLGSGSQIAVQIATSPYARSGGQAALTISIHKVPDGISVQIGSLTWFGVAASLGMTALSALRNPFSLISRIDDVAQDVESLQLEEETWKVIALSAKQHSVGYALSDRLRRSVCPYCNTANEVAAGRCIACGAPLGDIQPRTCLNCGFIVRINEISCPNCKASLPPIDG